jgi:hypothetical protein
MLSPSLPRAATAAMRAAAVAGGRNPHSVAKTVAIDIPA